MRAPYTLTQRIVENFALETFHLADDEDRAGQTDMNTAKTFCASGTFIVEIKIQSSFLQTC
jgi:hypothetical protein